MDSLIFCMDYFATMRAALESADTAIVNTLDAHGVKDDLLDAKAIRNGSLSILSTSFRLDTKTMALIEALAKAIEEDSID